ncbi:MAG TPA: RDD family protein [Clostridiaceae bacterium]|nr:RDD family protein [Clostridiaceae bacterium]
MQRFIEIPTPENVNLEFELAGLGSRFGALLIDALIQAGLILIAFLAMIFGSIDFANPGNYSSIVIAMGIVLVYLIFFGYHTFFELVKNGQTPGKRLFKLKVIKKNGQSLNFLDSFLRNILRIADFLPGFFLTGSLFIMFSSKYQRLGDFAANTLVVKTLNSEKPIKANIPVSDSDTDVPIINNYPVNNNEYAILKEFMEKRSKFGAREYMFTYRLNKYFMKKFNMEKPYGDPYEFFEAILKSNS